MMDWHPRGATKPAWAEWGDHPPDGPIEPWRINLLLATKPPGLRASYSEEWDYVRTMEVAERHAVPDQAARLRLHREDWQRRRREAERKAGERAYRASTEDWQAALNCRMRAPEVRGLTERQCAKLKVCFLDAKPLPPRRQHWCSDRCVEVWFKNHEWNWARHARVRIDKGRCVRCGAGANLAVNHIDPRYGRGYHKGCHHHLDRLETLCPPCHQIETNAQRTARISAQR